ncbi:hypothetical protein OG250_06640 [Streptomyces sp. NBC_00487]|uniref:hypothetical protein n=1 Tax=unclassified Streptomyces TaxID=2593676 RepID=UPI002E196576|nr:MULTISPECIES: hypothetical protein [unclassified Streptomyces]
MAKCVECGTAFEIEDARNEYNAEFNGDPDYYDERYGDGEFCGSCAAAETSGLINQGNAILSGEDYY